MKEKKFKFDLKLSNPDFSISDVLVYSFLINNYRNEELPSIDLVANCLYTHPDVVRLSILHLNRKRLIICKPKGDVYSLKFTSDGFVNIPFLLENSLFRLEDKGFLLKIYPLLNFEESPSVGLLNISLWDLSGRTGIDLMRIFDYIKYFTVIGITRNRVINKRDFYEFDFSNLSKYTSLINFPDGLSVNSWQNKIEELYDGKVEIPHYVFNGETRELRIWD